MVIIRTSALEVSIQAVSPALSGSGGGAAARAAFPVAISAPIAATAASPTRAKSFEISNLPAINSRR